MVGVGTLRMGASRLGRTRAAFASSVLWVVIIMSLCELLPLVDATKKQPSAVAVGAAAAVGAVATVAATAVVGATSAALVTVVGNSGTLTFAAAAAVTVVGGLGLASAMKSLDLRALSKGLQGKSSADGTNKGYTSSRRALAAWARVHCPDILGEDGLVKASKIIAGAQCVLPQGRRCRTCERNQTYFLLACCPYAQGRWQQSFDLHGEDCAVHGGVVPEADAWYVHAVGRGRIWQCEQRVRALHVHPASSYM